MKPSRKVLKNRKWAAKQPPEWHVWKGMKRRCYEVGHMMYFDYGGAGIRVCDRWREHRTGFKNFMADMGPRPSAYYHLDRIDPDGNYTKENCRRLHWKENLALSRGCFTTGCFGRRVKDELEQNDEAKSKEVYSRSSGEVPF